MGLVVQLQTMLQLTTLLTFFISGECSHMSIGIKSTLV